MKRSFVIALSMLLAAMLTLTTVCGALAEESSVNADFGLQEAEIAKGEEGYAAALYAAELYNYRVLRNDPVAFESAGWNTYVTKAGLLESIDASAITDADVEKIEAARDARAQLVQIASAADTRWFIWGESIPAAEDVTTLVFSNAGEDNADFVPYLVPYLVEDQSAVKSNMIVIAGGGYGSRNNSGEGYPIAAAFNKLGFNCFVLQRRVAPYSEYDVWMDMQRSIRYLRHYGEELGLGGLDNISASGFSGGSATIMGTVVNLYGDIQPTIYDAAYVPDEVDAENSDLDVAFLIYGPNWYATHEGEYVGFEGDNDNLPAMFIACGVDDNTGAPKDCLTLFDSVREKTLAELHIFGNVGHGFGVGLYGTNSDYWIAMADTFVDIAISKAAMDKGGIPEKYTMQQLMVVPFPFGEVEVTCAATDDGSEFYTTFTAFDEEQILSGVIIDGAAQVSFDNTGFFSNDVQMIVDCINPDAWEPIVRVSYELSGEYVLTQDFSIDFPFGTTEVTGYATQDLSKFVVMFNAFGDDQVMEGVLEDGVARVAYDMTGFFSNDIQLIADSMNPDGWQPLE